MAVEPHAQRLGIALRAALGSELALDAMDALGRDAGGFEQRKRGQAVVALLVLGRDTTLVGEPHLGLGPLLRLAREQLIRALGRAAPAQRDMWRSALHARFLEVAKNLLGGSLRGRLGVGAGGEARHGSIASAARRAGR